MLYSKKKSSSLWKRSLNRTNANTTIDDPTEIEDLKTATKRISIITRLEEKNIKERIKTNIKSNNHLNPSTELLNEKRPKTSKTEKFSSIGLAHRAYNKEKKANDKVMSEKYKSEEKQLSIKEGLLGEYNRYREMGKEELIEKLISLEYLANTIFKKNKHLEERLK